MHVLHPTLRYTCRTGKAGNRKIPDAVRWRRLLSLFELTSARNYGVRNVVEGNRVLFEACNSRGNSLEADKQIACVSFSEWRWSVVSVYVPNELRRRLDQEYEWGESSKRVKILILKLQLLGRIAGRDGTWLRGRVFHDSFYSIRVLWWPPCNRLKSSGRPFFNIGNCLT